MPARGRVTRGVAGVAACALAILSCASPTASAEKGGLVPIDVPRERLDAAHAPRRIALLVGIDQFEDPEWRALRYPAKDAADLARVLQDPKKGAFDQVETLTAGATREGVHEALRRLADVDRDERDTVVVYVSSHGTLARDASGALRRYLVARDTRIADVPGTAVSMDEIKGQFDALRSRRKVLILATCHSGGGKSLLPGDVQRELAGTKAGFFVKPIEEVSRASVVLAACDWGETAREDDRLANDIYTHYLVEALDLGADRNGDGAVTASEAHDYARRMTYDYTGGRQRPTAETTEVGADPIVLVGHVVRRGKPELYSYASALDGMTLKVNGKPLADLPGGVALDPGRYRVQLAKGGGPALVDLPLSLSPGERIDVEELVARRDGLYEIAPRVAVLGFLDAGSRRDVLGPVVGAGVTFSFREWPARRMALRLDVTGAAGSSSYADGGFSTPFHYSALTAGVALPWSFPLSFAPGLSLSAGPRLSAVYLERRFEVALARAPQSYFTMTPGVLLGAAYALGDRFTLGLDLQLDWMLVRVDGQNRSSGFGEMLLGAGYRF